MGTNDPALIEQGQTARHFQHPLDDEHHVRTAGVIFVETKGDIVLDRPRQHAVAEFRDLLAVLEHDRVLADQIDAGDVAVEVDAHAGPVEAGGGLLDVGRLPGAVIAGDHHPAVIGEAGEDRERRIAVEQIVRIEIRHVFFGVGISRRFHIGNRCRRACAPIPACRADREQLRIPPGSVSNSLVLHALPRAEKSVILILEFRARAKARRCVGPMPAPPPL